MDGTALKEDIRRRALALGFVEARFARAASEPGDAVNLARYLAEGRHGDMTWMDSERRSSLEALWPQARTVVVLGETYAPRTDPLAHLADPARGSVAVYARGRDYHDVVKKRLKALARSIVSDFGGEAKVFVDTAPLMEKPLAARAGLGWQGRHTNLVSRRFGSWLFLGSVFTTLDLPPDPAETAHCGRCHACESACPTGAIRDGRIDPRRCVSYLTIEHKGHIPVELRAAMGNRVYGCDDCLAACPWNKFARGTNESVYSGRVDGPALAELAGLDDAAFRARFAGSPIKRTGRDRFLRNVMIAVGNSARPDLARLAEARLNDASALVRAAAIWAIRRLVPAKRLKDFASRRLSVEADAIVRDEWSRQD